MFYRGRLEIKLRYQIDTLFREAGIVIAFLQRDVHLDSHKPIEIRVVKGENAENEPLANSESTAG